MHPLKGSICCFMLRSLWSYTVGHKLLTIRSLFLHSLIFLRCYGILSMVHIILKFVIDFTWVPMSWRLNSTVHDGSECENAHSTASELLVLKRQLEIRIWLHSSLCWGRGLLKTSSLLWIRCPVTMQLHSVQKLLHWASRTHNETPGSSVRPKPENCFGGS